LDNQSIRTQKRNHYPDLGEQALYKRSQKSLRAISGKPRKHPDLRLRYILLADGAGYTFKDEAWTLYVFLLKPVKSNCAHILEPVMIKGKESIHNWQKAIDSIPENVRERIVAFVSDNFQASKSIARHYGLIHQLCHFHLIKELRRRRGKRKNLGDRSVREAVYAIVRLAIETHDKLEMGALLKELKTLYQHPQCPYKFKMVIKEFTRTHDRYTAYLSHPKLDIPKTNNASESLVNMIRLKTKRLNSAKAVEQWAKATVILKQTMTCNGHKSTKLIT
jgi:transposase-like protein